MKTAIPITLTKNSYILFDLHQCPAEQVLQYLIDHVSQELMENGDKTANNILQFMLMHKTQLDAKQNKFQ